VRLRTKALSQNATAGEPLDRTDDEPGERPERGLGVGVHATAGSDSASCRGEAEHHQAHRHRTDDVADDRAWAKPLRRDCGQYEDTRPDDAIEGTGGERAYSDGTHEPLVGGAAGGA